MSKFFKASQPDGVEKDPKQCSANGCKVRASVEVGGNGWCCFAHAFAQVDDWQKITRGLNDHEWLLGLVKDVRRMEREFQDWRRYSTQFWQGTDDFCIPVAKEECVPYVNRMLMELLHRIGQSPKRPSPRVPTHVKPAGRFARSTN